jgi:hypothetical protein
MRRWPASALFFAGWVVLVSIISWKALQSGSPYWSIVGVLMGIAAAFLLLWRYNYSYLFRIPLVLGMVWLLMVPLTPLIPVLLLDVQTSRIRVGMTEAEVRTIMAGYRANPYMYTNVNGAQSLTFCYDDACDINTEVEFAAGRVVRARFILD